MKFNTVTLITLFTAQAAAVYLDKSSLKSGSQPAARSSKDFVPIVKHDDNVGHYLKEATGKAFKATGNFLKDAGTAAKNTLKTGIEDTGKLLKIGAKYRQDKGKSNLIPFP
ncbi:hypothetical protein DSO57_1026592 [Entomophthora muscae]|uniref:Uncharacterized protein n=1 Tax=Entomophthora muscae TaxID=34485 RepID=A0ACC2S3Z3_9FUNG|nr:hypothetical protein DSO57_1026592 [Entomophthora muscae]